MNKNLIFNVVATYCTGGPNENTVGSS